MDGMHQETQWAFTTGSDNYSASYLYELAPTPTIAQISLVKYFEFDDEAHVDLGFTSCSFVDQDGVTRTDTFLDIDHVDNVTAFARNGLVSASYEMRVSNCHAACLVNFFFWPNVF